MIVFSPNSPSSYQFYRLSSASELPASISKHLDNPTSTAQLIHRSGHKAAFRAYAIADEDAEQWGRGEHLPRNPLAWSVLSQLGFVNVMRRSYYNGPVVLVSASGQLMTVAEEKQVMAAWERARQSMEWETAPKERISTAFSLV